MKVVHISYFDRGGAANAALRLHSSLLTEGVESKFLCASHQQVNFPEVYQVDQPLSNFAIKAIKCLQIIQKVSLGKGCTNKRIAQIEKVIRTLFTQKKQLHKNYALLENKHCDLEIYTFPQTDFDLAGHPMVKQADLINLHWTGNFLDWPSFFKNVKKPIVWTLHDMNPFMGGFHYLGDQYRNMPLLENVEKALLKVKKDSLPADQNMTIVSPSKWLMEESKNSEVLGRFLHHHVPYGLPTDIFKPLDKKISKTVFNLPSNKKIILFVSENINTHRKGFALLLDALKRLDKEDYVLAVLGKGAFDTNSLLIYQLGFIKDERLLSLAYAAADLFVIPSTEDNLPNTVIESLACGTPVVGFDVGGIPDMIVNNENGIVVDKICSTRLALGIQRGLNSSFDQIKIATAAFQHFDSRVQAKQYSRLYKNLLRENRNKN